MIKGGPQHHAKNIKGFVALLTITEIVLIVLYGVFVRFEKMESNSSLNVERYPAFQDINVMMLIGFGFLMAFSKTFSWSAVTYTFFVNAVSIQIYILLSAFWKRIISTGFNSSNYYIFINELDFTLALYSAASMFINIGCTIGRVGPLQTLIMAIFHQIGYTLNEEIVMHEVKAFDVGGSMLIHAFGAYGGLTVSLILGSMTKPTKKPQMNYFSNLFAMIGTFFLWMYWPSFNFGAFATTAFTKTQIIGNTVFSLTGSCLGTFAASAYVKEKFTMEHILNATLAGGVVIGASAGIITHPGGAMAIGFLIGIISTIGYQYLTPYLQKRIGLFDTCGVHNLHGIPGLLGGIVSAIVAASFYYPSSVDAYSITAADFPEYDTLVASPFKQGGLQIAGTFISIGMAIITSVICGIFLKFVYSFNANEFFSDGIYFQEAQQYIEQLKLSTKEDVSEKEGNKAGAQIVLNVNGAESLSHIHQ